MATITGIERLAERAKTILHVGAQPGLRAATSAGDEIIEAHVASAPPSVVPRRSPKARGGVARKHVEPRAHAAPGLEGGEPSPEVFAHLREDFCGVGLGPDQTHEKAVDLGAVVRERPRGGSIERAFSDKRGELGLEALPHRARE